MTGLGHDLGDSLRDDPGNRTGNGSENMSCLKLCDTDVGDVECVSDLW